jgi:Ca2+-dependent lipid-binding protein
MGRPQFSSGVERPQDRASASADVDTVTASGNTGTPPDNMQLVNSDVDSLPRRTVDSAMATVTDWDVDGTNNVIEPERVKLQLEVRRGGEFGDRILYVGTQYTAGRININPDFRLQDNDWLKVTVVNNTENNIAVNGGVLLYD